MNNSKKTFRSAFSGYNREDVNQYIMESDLKYSEELAELKNKVETLEKKLKDEVTIK